MVLKSICLLPSIIDGSTPGLFRCGRQVQCVEVFSAVDGRFSTAIPGVQGGEEWEQNEEVQRAGREGREKGRLVFVVGFRRTTELNGGFTPKTRVTCMEQCSAVAAGSPSSGKSCKFRVEELCFQGQDNTQT